MAQDQERVEVVVGDDRVAVDPATARWLRSCTRKRGGSMAEATVWQLRELALADSVRQHAAFFAERPSFFEDAEAEREAAGAA